MSKCRYRPAVLWAAAAACLIAAAAPSKAGAQQFDFARLEENVRRFSVIIEMDIEISFGVHSSEQTERYLGTIVTDSGLVIFDGSAVSNDAMLGSISGFTVKTEPKKVTLTTMDGNQYDGEYIGFDRFTNLGFIQIKANGDTFTPVQFTGTQTFRVGQWLGLYMLLPEFVTPPLAADLGMVSALVTSPEPFALTVGFSSMQAASVLFNENLEPVGVLGALVDPSMGESMDMMGSMGQPGAPLMGVVSTDRLADLIAKPPTHGESDRGWLGITLQALTKDMSDFWGLAVGGGIIVNEVVSNSPAAEAGLAVSDIIVEVNGQPVDVDKEEKLPVFQRMISDLGPGTPVELGVLRRTDAGGVDTLQVLVTLGDAPIAASDAEELEVKEFEFKVRNLVFADYMITNQDPDDFDGVVVAEIEMGGLADISGLQIGDIIQRLGSVDIMSVEDVQAVMQELKTQRPREVILFVWRGGKTMFVNLKTDWASQ